MKYKTKIIIYSISDGNSVQQQVVDDSNTVIQFYFGESFFESDAYHAKGWAEECGYQYFEETREIEFEPNFKINP